MFRALFFHDLRRSGLLCALNTLLALLTLAFSLALREDMAGALELLEIQFIMYLSLSQTCLQIFFALFYRRSLFEREGILETSLPIKAHHLILEKSLLYLVYSFIGLLIGLAVFLLYQLFLYSVGSQTFVQSLPELQVYIEQLRLEPILAFYLLAELSLVISLFIDSIATALLCASFSVLLPIKNRRLISVALAFGAAFILYYLLSYIFVWDSMRLYLIAKTDPLAQFSFVEVLSNLSQLSEPIFYGAAHGVELSVEAGSAAQLSLSPGHLLVRIIYCVLAFMLSLSVLKKRGSRLEHELVR